jgi:hypothetical protein
MFCWSCLSSHLADSRACPHCGKRLSADDLTPIYGQGTQPTGDDTRPIPKNCERRRDREYLMRDRDLHRNPNWDFRFGFGPLGGMGMGLQYRAGDRGRNLNFLVQIAGFLPLVLILLSWVLIGSFPQGSV